MKRLRDLGVDIGSLEPGPNNAITDVAGVSVGHSTIISGSPGHTSNDVVRSGVTVVRPRTDLVRKRPLFAGAATLNGNGEMTGLEWIRESGLLTTDIGLTGTHSVGVVRDALVTIDTGADSSHHTWSLPVVGETSDLNLSGGGGQHVTAQHVFDARDAASSGPVLEGSVGGGTGMICHGFKGGIGTSSRRVGNDVGEWTVGVLVQANHGTRDDFRVDGVPVGRSRRFSDVPSPGIPDERSEQVSELPQGAGSIIAVIATDAPLLPDQCRRLATRAGLGVARGGGGFSDSSGDIFLAFATGNDAIPAEQYWGAIPHVFPTHSVPHQHLDGVFRAVIEATEEAIVNAMLASPTMVGANGFTAHGLDPELLRLALDDAGRVSDRRAQ